MISQTYVPPEAQVGAGSLGAMSAPRVTTAPKVVAVTATSPAALSGLRSGDELLSLNGRSPRDVIEYSLLVDEPELDLVVRRRGVADPFPVAVRKEAVTCPYYLTSSNAITMEGELVNTDGIGNRVAGMIFGPEVVVVLAGANKLVEDRAEAFSRIRNVAAPANARRLGLDVPCVERGRCADCRTPQNICRVTSIVSLKPMWTDLKVFLVAEPLGL